MKDKSATPAKLLQVCHLQKFLFTQFWDIG